MLPVVITALGVGGATMVGALIGFAFKNLSHKFSDYITALAAGVMLAAAVVGLIIPSFENGGDYAVFVTVVGIFAGALFLNVLDKLVPHVHQMLKPDGEKHENGKLGKVILFVMAIAIHNFPEGLAAGVGFGSDNPSQAIVIAIAIALQNIPEGIVIIAPMLSEGVSKSKTLLCALMTGLVEVIGTFIGYFIASISAFVLPFALAFAGGTMLYVVSDEMIIETHSHGEERGATYFLILGFCIMLITDALLG